MVPPTRLEGLPWALPYGRQAWGRLRPHATSALTP
jgi:hypothetical protein